MKKIFLILLTCILLCSCSDKKVKTYSNIDDLKNSTVGFIIGTFHDQYIEENHSDKNIKAVYQSSSSNLLMSLRAKKIDCFAIDTPIAKMLQASENDISSFEIENTDIPSAFLFSNKNDELINDFNNFVISAKESGYLEKLEDKWINNINSDEKIDKKDYAPTKRTIKVIINSGAPPYGYISNGELTGMFTELLYEFGYESGYSFEIDQTDFDGVLSGISSGKYDIGVDDVSMTEERKKNLVFSEPVHSNSISIVYLNENNNDTYTSPYDLKDKKMGCMSGSIYDVTIKEKLGNSDIDYYNSRSELIMGLQSKKIEGYLADKPVAIVCCQENESIKYLDEALEHVDYGFCFSKNASNIRLQFNEFLKKISDNGQLSKLQEKWINENAIEQKIDNIELTGENGTIKACTTPDAAPFSFFKNGKYEGYEVELINLFAKEYGYNVQIDSVSFDAIISAISSNKYDMAFNGIYITEERKMSVDFSDPVCSSSVVAVVRSGEETKTSFIESLKNKFYTTFVEEDRYKIILNGIKTTLIITVASLVIGTACGFVAFLLSRKTRKWLTKLFDTIAYIVDGLPVVVLLMVLFYIIFAQSSLNGTMISILGFSLIICCSVYGMLKTGVGAIDKGQFEGALALGYTDNQTLFKFILPQALRIIMPSYRGEIVSLIKSSSVVGYVTVEDLTRASDLIRSRTYDAFFPLIITAIIYFILAWLITKIVNKIQIKYLPSEKSKKEILKSLK